MSDDNYVGVKIVADTSQLQAGIDAASHEVKHVMTEIGEAMTSTTAIGTALGVVIGGVMLGAFEKLTESIGDSIHETIEFREAADMLGRKLGTTATEANNIALAIDDIHSSTEEYTGAAKGMERLLRTNEDAMKKMGLTTRDAHGNMRPLNDLMMDGIAIVNTYKEGTDRNIASQQLFGRGIQDGSKLLDYNKEAYENGKEAAERYGLVVGVEAVEDLEAFKKAQNEAHDALDGVSNAAGNALLPILTKLSQWWAVIAPAAILVVKVAVGVLATTFLVLKDTVYDGLQIMGGAIEAFGVTLRVVIDGLVGLAHGLASGDFSEAKAAWNKGGTDLAEISKRHFKNIQDAANETKETLSHIWGAQTEQKEGDHGGKNATTKSPKDPKAAADPSEIPKMKAQLDAKIELEKGYFRDSLQLEIDFWTAKKNLSTTSADDKVKIEHMVYQLNKKLAHEQLADQLETLKQQGVAEGQAGAERVRLAHAATALIAANYGLESKEYKKAMMDEVAAMTDANNAILKMDAIEAEARKNSSIASIDLETEHINQMKAMGEISDLDQINGLIQLEEKKYQIEAKAAKAKAALIVNDVVALRAANAKILADAEKHELDLDKLRNKRVLLEKQAALNVASATQSAMQASFAGMMNGTMTFAQGMRGIFKGMADGVIGEIARMASEWIVQHALMALFGKKTANSEIATSAAKAGAAGVASFAGAPWPIDIGAPAFGMAMSGAAMGYAGLSAEGGFDIPSGVNPLVQTHQKEMILPAEHADTIRGLAGGKSGSAPIVINTKGGEFVHVKDMANLLKTMNRNFVFKKI